MNFMDIDMLSFFPLLHVDHHLKKGEEICFSLFFVFCLFVCLFFPWGFVSERSAVLCFITLASFPFCFLGRSVSPHDPHFDQQDEILEMVVWIRLFRGCQSQLGEWESLKKVLMCVRQGCEEIFLSQTVWRVPRPVWVMLKPDDGTGLR